MKILISGGQEIRLSNSFIFPDPDPSIIKGLCGGPGMFGQFGLYMLLFSFVIEAAGKRI